MPGTNGNFSLQQGIASAKAGNLLLARIHFQQALTLEPENANIWLWLAWVAESPACARQCLEWILQRHPGHALARLGLDWAQAMDAFDLEALNAPAAPASALQDTDHGGQTVIVSARTEPAPPAPATVVEVTELVEPEPVEPEPVELPIAEPEPRAVNPPPAPQGPLTYEQDRTVSYGLWNHPPELLPPLYRPAGDPLEAPALEEAPHLPAAPRAVELMGRETPSDVQEKKPATPALAPTRPDDRLVVLVVDDSPTIRKLVAMTLNDQLYRVISAPDGVEAISQIAEHHPALVLLDINMPRLDGYKLCKLIRKNDQTKKIPVVMLSGKDGTFDKLRGRLVGCTDYITKPFETETLQRVVEKYAGKSA